MRAVARIGCWVVALIAAVLALGGCDERTVVGHRLGPARVEPGRQALPASPCLTFGRNGTTEVHLFSDAPHCTRVRPGERLLFVNDTGIGPAAAPGEELCFR